VLDGHGQPVSGLTRDDFVVKEDGRPQAVTAFEAVNVRRPALSSPDALVTTVPSAAAVSTNVTAPPTDARGRDRRPPRGRPEHAAGEAGRSGVRVAGGPSRGSPAFPTTSDGRYWTTTRGPDDEAWREALGRVRSHQRLKTSVRCRINPYEAMRIEEFGDSQVCALVQRRLAAFDCKDSRLDCGRGPLAALEVLTPARAGIRRSLNLLREVARSLAQSPGRKQVDLMSEGFILDPLLDSFREVQRQDARSNVVIRPSSATQTPSSNSPLPHPRSPLCADAGRSAPTGVRGRSARLPPMFRNHARSRVRHSPRHRQAHPRSPAP